VSRIHLFLIALYAISVVSCQAKFERRPSVLDRPRVLAIGMDPPEAAVGKSVRLTALIAGPEGKITSAVAWSLCTQRPQVAGYNAIAEGCLDGSSAPQPQPQPMATGDGLEIVVPKNACAVFGSEPPPGSGNEAPIRPFDADATGGYYQPLVVALGEARGTSGIRLSCSLFQATAETARAFRERYVPNTNPTLRDVVIPERIERNQAVTFRVRTNAPESYVAYDPVRSVLVERTERLDLSWYVTKGALRDDTSIAGSDSDAENTYVAPNESGIVHVFVVLRDERGGIAFESRAIDVR
jgi:hypothetical protein